MSDPIKLRARALHGLTRPGIAKAREYTWEQHCQERAIASFSVAVEEAGGNSACAKVADCHESTIRFKRAGAKNILLVDAWKLPKRAAYKLADELLTWAESLPDEESLERTGS